MRLYLAVTGVLLLAFVVPSLAQAAPPPNDNIASAEVIGGASGTAFGTRVEATAEAAEVPSMPHSHSIWYAWTAPAYGVISFDTAGTAWAWSFAGQVDTAHMKINGQRYGFFPVSAGATYLIGLDDWNDGGPTQFTWSFRETPPPPANDDWTSPQPLRDPAGTVTFDTSGATRQDCDGDLGGGPTVWYSWVAPQDGELTFQANVTDRGTIAGLYTYDGTTPCAAQFARSGGDAAVANVTAGTRYLIGAGTWGDNGGPASFTYSFATVVRPSNDDFANAAPFGSAHRGSVSGSAQHATSEPGEPTPLGSKTVWYTWTPDVDGVASVDFKLGDGIVFTGDSLGSLVTLAYGGGRFDVTAGTTYRVQVAATGDYTVEWLLEPNTPPANDMFAAAQPIEGASGYVESTNRLATFEAGEPNHGGSSSASVWFTWVAPADGDMVFWVDSSSWALVQAYVGSDLLTLTPAPGAVQQPEAQRVTFPAVAGTTYRIAVDSRAGGTSVFWLGWLTHVDGGPPATRPTAANDAFETPADTSLTVQPADLLVNDFDPDGDSVSMNAVGNALDGHGTVEQLADGSIVFTPDAGYVGDASFLYTIVDSTGLESTVATVTVHVMPVNHPPKVTLVAPSTMNEGDTVALTAQASDPDGDTLTYKWSASTGTISGKGADVTLFVDDGPATVKLTLTVSDGRAQAKATRAVSVANVAPTVSYKAPAGPWGVPLQLTMHASDPSKADTAAGFAPTWIFGDSTESGDVVTHVFASPAANRGTVTATDKDGGTSSRTVVAKIFGRASSLAYTGPATAPFGFASVGAQLSDTLDPTTAKLAGHALTFSVGGLSLAATTSAAGSGSADVGPLLPGSYAVDAQFAGDLLYGRSAAAGNLTVVNSVGKVNGDVTLQDGTRVVFAATGDGTLVRGSLSIGSLTGSVTALGLSGNVAWLAGATVDGRSFVATVKDAAEPGKGVDEVRVWLDGAERPGGGVIADGNVQLHK